jgi:hypothetical protein
MKRCNKRGNISRVTHNSGTKGTETRDVIIHIIRGMFFYIIFLSILP